MIVITKKITVTIVKKITVTIAKKIIFTRGSGDYICNNKKDHNYKKIKRLYLQ
jgi:hypothetical protein